MASPRNVTEAEWSKFVGKVSQLAPRKQRAIASVVGALVADAAGQALHWVYDVDKLQGILTGVSEPEFMDQHHCPFYRVETGGHGPCGDQAVVQLQSLADCKGFNLSQARDAFMKKYGPGSEIFEAARVREEKGDKTYPVQGPWTNGTVKFLVKAVTNNESSTAEASDDPDCVVRCIPVAAYYAGNPDLLKIASECVSLMQKGDIAVASTLTYCRTLEKLILTDNATVSFEKILEGVVQELENPKRDFPHAHDSVVGTQLKDVLGMDRTMNNALTTKQIGSSCPMPPLFKSAFFLILQKGDVGYVEGVRNVITSSGDNCSRANLVGACLGAKHGLSSIPVKWALKTKSIGSVVTSLETLFL